MVNLKELAESYRTPLVAFCQRLIQTPSLPGEEGDVARLVNQEMENLGYDEVRVDEAGNVVGIIRGCGSGKTVMLNIHMDQVPTGDPESWPFPPHSGQISDGALWGRGASDGKGALAAMVYAGAALKRAGLKPMGDVVVAGVVMEEVGGPGTRHLISWLRPDYAIIGEATSNGIALGHRGRLEIIVKIKGKAAHASVLPQKDGANPFYPLARFINRLPELSLAEDPFLGPAAITPTRIISDQPGTNVIPGEIELVLDCREVPSEPADKVLAKLRPLLEASMTPGCSGTAELKTLEFVTYTGKNERRSSAFSSFVIPSDHPLVKGAQEALRSAFGREVPLGRWNFATDGGCTMEAGIPTIGFAPTEEAFCHTVEDRVSIDMMVEGVAGYAALALRLTEHQK